MIEMTTRERFAESLDHQEAGRTPIYVSVLRDVKVDRPMVLWCNELPRQSAASWGKVAYGQHCACQSHFR